MIDVSKLDDKQLINLINSRWNEGDSVFSIVSKTYDKNTIAYDSDTNSERLPEYLRRLPNDKPKVRANRIFANTEAVINAVIANPPKPNILPNRSTQEAIDLAQLQEKFFVKRYEDRNVKETLRKALRNLYFSRLMVIKVFWNSMIDDFDVVSVDPRKIRVSPKCTKEEESEYCIEEVEADLITLLGRFSSKKAEILEKFSYKTEEDAYINNPKCVYKECWIDNRLVCKYNDLILSNIRNPYWDWDGMILTEEEQNTLASNPEKRKSTLEGAYSDQYNRQPETTEGATEGDEDESGINTKNYFFNHFNYVRKPYIFATILNNENSPIGRTSFIEESASLQENVDRRKQQIHDNADMMNGLLKVDSSVVSSKAGAQKIRRDIAAGFIWGKGVVSGVAIDTGSSLPGFIMEDMIDSRNEIDNIMAASSAFRGERQGQETKAGRLALIEQSYLRLNELVQVIDYVCQEMFNWMYHLAKVKYTETHYAKEMGEDNALKVIELQRNDFEDGVEVKVISGKTLPEDRQFKMEQAQADVQKGIIAPIDYFKTAGYDNPSETAQNAVKFQLNPAVAVGISPEELAQLVPPQESEKKPPSASISFKDLPLDGQIQLAEQAGIQLNPELALADNLSKRENSKKPEPIIKEDKTIKDKV